jgi:hypothetical protein
VISVSWYRYGRPVYSRRIVCRSPAAPQPSQQFLSLSTLYCRREHLYHTAPTQTLHIASLPGHESAAEIHSVQGRQ